MKRELTKEELHGMWTFLVETFEFSEEQCNAIDHQIPMTQELFDSILDRCAEIGKDAENLFFRMLKEYPDYTDARANRMLKALEDKDSSDSTEEELELWRQKLFAKIIAKYGADEL